MSFLLDTCVISELVRPTPNPSVLAWVRNCDEETLYLSVLTIGELEKGIAKLGDSVRKKKLESWVRHELAARFKDRILPLDLNVAARWGTLVGESERRGMPLPVIDSLLAATCLHHGLTVATCNKMVLERCGARCFNPWAKN